MPVRTKRLAVGNSAPAGAGKTVYTAPAGETVIVKDIRVQAGSGASVFCALLLVSGPTAVALYSDTLAADAAAGVSTWAVLQPGDKVNVFSAGGTFTFWVSGAELEGVAD